MRLIDLSHPIVPFADNPYAQFPVGPKNMMGVTNVFADVGWFSRAWYLGEHCGTHVDAPVHFNPAGTPVDRLPLDWLFGEAVVLDFASKKAGEDVTASEVAGAVAGLDGGGLGDARIVLVRSERSRLWGTPEYHRDMINMSPEATEWLLRRHVRVVGCDACVWEVDRGSRPEASGRRLTGAERFPSHALMRAHDFVIIENLANLGQLSRSRVTFLGLPLPLVGGSGSPIRAAALVPE
jgi:kynurenine formamidase